jgi:single-stranded-DNA-specific exonuclease
MKKWVEIRKSGNFVELAKEYGVSPVVARILRNRDLLSKEEVNNFLSFNENILHDPFLLPGMDRVIFVLKEKIEAGKKIRIIGDYDVDGISATFILYKGLKYFGADCDYVIPHRIEDGYGINIKLIENAVSDGIDTIITCDNGIAASAQTDYANECGITMLITDHHEVPFEDVGGERNYIIPKAEAVTDPKLPDSSYPFEGICGAMVAYKLILAYASKSDSIDAASFNELKEELLEFAGIATVCDVMELRDENRFIVKKALKSVARSKNMGLRSLLKVTGLEGKALSAFHFGFVIGPCLNASGRLDTSLKALSLFLCEDEEEALNRAEELKNLNEERKYMTMTEAEKAFEMVDSMETVPKVLVIYLPDCHESLAGIIAGRVREKYVRPTFVLTKTEKGLKGSGRSIEAYDMYEGLNKAKDLLTKFGGHKMAAGISLEESNLEEFKKRINETADLKEDDFVDSLRIDMELPFRFADLNLAKELEILEPFGVGNDKPIFAKTHVKFLTGKKMGKNNNVGKYRIMDDEGKVYDLIYFGDLQEFEDYVRREFGDETADNLHGDRVLNIYMNICYYVSVNSFRGVESVQYIMQHYQ